MESGDIPVLTRLSDSDHAIPSADEDIRGRKVTDRSGNELGKVGDLIIDEEEHKVRFLLLEHGGFLGVGKEKSYIPVDAVAGVSEDQVRIDRTRDQVVDAPEYDPELVQQDELLRPPLRPLRLPALLGARLRVPALALSPLSTMPSLAGRQYADRHTTGSLPVTAMVGVLLLTGPAEPWRAAFAGPDGHHRVRPVRANARRIARTVCTRPSRLLGVAPLGRCGQPSPC